MNGAGSAARHVPVLLERTAELLDPALSRPGAVHVDGTLGLGGHAEYVLRRYPGVRLIGLDRDPAALAAARERLRPYEQRTTVVHLRYDEVATALQTAGLPAGGSVDGILLDLGVSSMQLDESDRGFAYAVDAPLDMRMDTTTGPTAAEVLNTYSQGELARILKTFGEERFAAKIAARIVRRRAERPFARSAELVELLYDTIPAATRRRGGHPAKRTFQALRMEVNGELASLRAALPAALRALRVGGRIVVLSYHSLEDRVVKEVLRAASASGTPLDLPMELPDHEPEFRLVVRGSESAGETELDENPRAASVRLRAAERVRVGSEKGCGA